MVRYYKEYIDGFLFSVGTGPGYIEITEAEYIELMEMMANKPTPPPGYGYRINEQNEYVLVEAPIIEPDENEELTADETLDILTGGADE